MMLGLIEIVSSEVLRLERTTNPTSSVRELIVGAGSKVLNVLHRSDLSLISTTELTIKKATRASNTVTGHEGANVSLIMIDIGTDLVIHDVDYYGTFGLTCKLFVTKG